MRSLENEHPNSTDIKKMEKLYIKPPEPLSFFVTHEITTVESLSTMRLNMLKTLTWPRSFGRARISASTVKLSVVSLG